MQVAIGCDHAAVEMKNMVVEYLKSDPELNKVVTNVIDFGAHDEKSVDYPDYAKLVCDRVNTSTEGSVIRGVLLCGSGIGMSIAANKFDGIRAALCHDHYTALMCREHNDANVLCAGARTSGPEIIKQMVKVYIQTPFSNSGNHPRRVAKIASFEKLTADQVSESAKAMPQDAGEMLSASVVYNAEYKDRMKLALDAPTDVMQSAAPFLGFTLSEDGSGLVVESVYQAGPADQVGIEPGDSVLAVGKRNRKVVTTLDEFRAAKLLLCVCGKLTNMTIKKNGVTKDVQLWVMTSDPAHESQPYYFNTEVASKLTFEEPSVAEGVTNTTE